MDERRPRHDDPMKRQRGTLTGGRAALGIAVAGALVMLALNVLLTITFGLVAVAAVTGYLVGGALRERAAGMPAAAGAGSLGSARDRGMALTMALAVGAVLSAALGTWLVAIVAQGGSLGPVDYLAQTMGILLPVQVLVAAGTGWLGSR